MKATLCCLFTFFFLVICASGQDTTWAGIQRAKDDTFKVKRLIQYYTGHNQSALGLQACEQALMISKRIDYPYGAGRALFNIAIYKLMQSKHREAIEDLKSSVVFFKKAGDKRMVSRTYESLMEVYGELGDKDSAIQYNTMVLQLLEREGNGRELFYAYYTLAGYFSRTDPDRSRQYYLKALDIAQKKKDPDLLVEILTIISNKFQSFAPDSLLSSYANEALAIAHRSGDTYLMGIALNNKAGLFIDKRRPDSAIYYAQRAVDVSKDYKSTNVRMHALFFLSDCYELLHDYSRQAEYLKKGLVIAEKMNDRETLANLYPKLSKAVYRTGSYQEAYEFLERSQLFHDSLQSARSDHAIAELEVKYKTAEQKAAISEKQLLLAQKDVQLQKSRQYNLYSIGIALAALVITAFIYVQYKHKRKLHHRQLKAIEQEKEIQLLEVLVQGEEQERRRIAKELHDGVAAVLSAAKMHLQSLSMVRRDLSELNGYKQCIQLVDDAYVDVRKTSHNLFPEVLIRHGLDEALRLFCGRISNDQVLIVSYDSWGYTKRYKDSFELTVYRIVQELLNNIIKHSRANKAIVQMTEQEDYLFLSIEDNGIGFSSGAEHDGMGLKSLRSRVEAMNGTLEFTTKDGEGVNVSIKFETKGLVKSQNNTEL